MLSSKKNKLSCAGKRKGGRAGTSPACSLSWLDLCVTLCLSATRLGSGTRDLSLAFFLHGPLLSSTLYPLAIYLLDEFGKLVIGLFSFGKIFSTKIFGFPS